MLTALTGTHNGLYGDHSLWASLHLRVLVIVQGVFHPPALPVTKVEGTQHPSHGLLEVQKEMFFSSLPERCL